MKAIFEKELKSYFTSSVGYVFAGVIFMLTALQFVMFLISKNTDFIGLTTGFGSLIVYIIPILIIGTQEKEKNINRLLFTTPNSTASIVLGKFFAALCFYVITILLTLTFSLILANYSQVNFMTVLNSYFALAMFGSLLLSIGLFAKSLTSNKATAIIAVLGALSVSNVISFIKQIPELPQYISKIIDFISIQAKFNGLFGTIISPESFIYFLTLTVVFILLAIITVNIKLSNK